jgi:glycosyltransferase involved in cell wall biosynthesis
MTAPPGAGAPLAFFLPNLEGGGAERVTLNLAAGFAARGFKTDLVLVRAEGPLLAHVPSAVRVLDLKAPAVLRSVRPLAAYLRRERPRVLLAALTSANLVAMASARMPGVSTRTVISIHCSMIEEMRDEPGLRSWALPWLIGRFHRWADAIVAVSEGAADDLVRAVRIPRERIDVIYNPIITPEVRRRALDPPPHPWFADAAGPVVIGVGRLTRQKNFPALVEAFALVMRQQPAARLVILGEGPEREVIAAQVRRHGLEASVALPGFVDNPYACIARAAVFALSSDFEGLPTVLIESLALGTPVVSTDCPSGPREILRGGALGSLVPVGDIPALARAIVGALTSPRFSPPAEALERFLPDVVLDQYQRLFRLQPKPPLAFRGAPVAL